MNFALILTVLATGAFAIAAGRRPYRLRIRMIGGEPVSNTLYPYVLFIDSSSTKCLASVINPSWIITSSLCFPNTNLSSVIIKSPSSTCEIHPQKQFNEKGVSLIKIDPLEIHKTISVGALKSNNAFALGRLNSNTDALSRLHLNIVDGARCKDVKDFNEKTHICTFGGLGKDICNVDIGAPLIDPSSQKLVGIYNNVLSGVIQRHHCEEDHSHVLPFLRVVDAEKWISDTIEAN